MPEEYIGVERPETLDFKKDMLVHLENAAYEKNLTKIIDDSFEMYATPLDWRLKGKMVKYIIDWKLKSWENQEIESYIRARMEHPSGWKLKYLYDNTWKPLSEVLLAIYKKEWKKDTPTPPTAVASVPQTPKVEQPKPTVQTPKVKPVEITTSQVSKLESWLNEVSNVTNRIISKAKDAFWWITSKVSEIANTVYDALSDRVVTTFANSKDVPSELIPTLWKMFKEAENWMNTIYRYWWTTKKWIDCSAFVSRLLSIGFGNEYVRYTTTTLKTKCERIPSAKARAWDLQFSNKGGHVEMIVSRPWKEWGKWFVNTLWSANSRPYDQNGNRIAHSWPWYRKRALTSSVYRPNAYKTIIQNA